VTREGRSGAADPEGGRAVKLPSARRGMVALLFADVVDSTVLLRRLGDDAGEQVLRTCLDHLRRPVESFDGREVKALGDGLLAAFPTTASAVASAVEMLGALNRHNASPGSVPLAIRIGVHAGEPLEDEAGDLIGIAVAVARRLCDAAAGGQILVSETVRGFLGNRSDLALQFVGRLDLKGVGERVGAYELVLPAGGAERRPVVGPHREPNSVPSMASTAASDVLRSRTRPPRAPRSALQRTGVVERIQSGLSGSLVLIVAGAGYGKSTGALQAVTSWSAGWAWCSCDRRMTSAPAFAAHLIAAVEDRLPGFGAGQGANGEPAELAAFLVGELEATLSEDLVLVIDDVHLLVGGDSWGLLAALVGDLPEALHLVLASRLPLPLALGRLRARGEVLEIGEADLSLDPDEAVALAKQVAPELPTERVAELLQLTEGWPAGFALAARRGGSDPDTAAASTREDLFDYLAEEVLSALQPRDRRILEKLSLLDRVSPELAAVVTGDPHAGAVLTAAVRDQLFVTRVDAEGDWVRYHHLLREHLRRSIARRPEAELRELHQRAAVGWARIGNVTESVRHLLEAGDQAAAVDALEPVAEGLVLTPDAEELASFLEAIPRDLWSGRPSLILASGVMAYSRGMLEASFSALEDAVVELAGRGEHDRASVALVRLWQSMNAAGTAVRHRIAVAERLLNLIDERAAMVPLARLMVATGYAWSGRRAEAEAKMAEILGGPRGGDPAVAAFGAAARAFYIDYLAGAPESAAASLGALRRRLESLGTAEAGTLAVFVAAFRTIVLNDLRRFDDALAELEHAIQGSRRHGLLGSARRTLAWLRLVSLAGLGRLDELASELIVPPEPVDGVTETHYAYRFLAPAAALAAARGDGGGIERIAGAARRAIAAQGPEADQPGALCDIGEAAATVGSVALAEGLLREALERAAALDMPRHRARACIMLADLEVPDASALALEAVRIADAFGDVRLWTEVPGAAGAAAIALALEAGEDHDRFLSRVLTASAPAELEAVVERVLTMHASTRRRLALLAAPLGLPETGPLARLRSDADPAVRRAARAPRPGTARPAAFEYRGLGGFLVLRDGEAVPRSAFGREKARMLLASLLCAGRPVHREELLEWHWPELPLDRAVRAFHVTMHSLRRALEPELPRGARPSSVISTGESYRVVLNDLAHFDARELVALARAAPAGDPDGELERRLAIEEACSGPLFPEWPYAPWAEERRRECEEVHASNLQALSAILVEQGRPREAIVRLSRLLVLEPEREEWHRALMVAYRASGERALALRQFHACRSVLRRELGVEPSPETQELYKRLLGAPMTRPARAATP
jgi:class 3 adenylate cyclase/DNA-binding SARP family transcriptional activator